MTGVICADFPRLCIRVVGNDSAKYLHSQLSNDIESLDIGRSCHSFVLEPSGKVIALVRVTRISKEEFLLDTDPVPHLEEVLLARLHRFKIRVDVEFVVDVRTCVAIRSSTDTIRTSMFSKLPQSEVIVVDAMWSDGRSLDVIPLVSGVDAKYVKARLGDQDVLVGSETDVEMARVRDGWPAMGREIDPGESLAAATGVVTCAVSFTKGCYPGQELVERMDSRGSSAPRALRRCRRDALDPGDPIAVRAGHSIIVDGHEIGIVTSVAGEWALAYVQRGIEFGEPINPVDRVGQ